MMNKKRILLWGLIFISLAVFISVVYAKDIGANKLIIPKLNSLSVDTANGASRLSLGIEVAQANFTPALDIKKTAEKSLEYFFIGLVMPDEKFWVNLNPKEPYRMLDSALADTDLGRIMLYADLRLKKDTCALMDPNESEAGVEYWNRLYIKAKSLGATDKIPAINRIWIVPDKLELCETENRLAIVKSKLRVCIEENKRGEPLQDYALSLMEELILPRLNEKVNESALYADLREVYQALILARWYKQKFGQQHFLTQNVSYNIIKDAQIDFFYRPDQIYRDYINSYKKGEYTFSDGAGGFYSAMTIMQYFIGGINFKKMPAISFVNEPDKPDSGAVFNIKFNMPNEWPDNPLQLVKNTMEVTPGEMSYGGVAVVKKIPADATKNIFADLPPVIIEESVNQKIQYTGDKNKTYIIAFNNKL